MKDKIFIVCKFIGCGYTRGHIAQQRRIAQWNNIQAFASREQAEKFVEMLKNQDASQEYDIDVVKLMSFHEKTAKNS